MEWDMFHSHMNRRQCGGHVRMQASLRREKRAMKGVALIHGGSSQLQLGGNLVHLKSTRQSLISKSSCEAELLAL
eukprot:594138-Amphidinium_carterae.1